MSSHWLKATNTLIALATQKLDRESSPKLANHPTNLQNWTENRTPIPVIHPETREIGQRTFECLLISEDHLIMPRPTLFII
jgi:hypothetical protein